MTPTIPTASLRDSGHLLEALEKARAQLDRIIGWHTAPGDCYATGPLTGNPYVDLVSCPSCEGLALMSEIDAAIAKAKGSDQ